jgi:hypothetical protein
MHYMYSDKWKTIRKRVVAYCKILLHHLTKEHRNLNQDSELPDHDSSM